MSKKKRSRKELTRLVHATPVRHNELDDPQIAVARWTHQRAGKYLKPSFEQWEFGFTKDSNPDGELAAWVIISLALESWASEQPCTMMDADCQRYVSFLSIVSLSGGELTEESSEADHQLFEDAKRRFEAAKEIYREVIDRILEDAGLVS